MLTAVPDGWVARGIVLRRWGVAGDKYTIQVTDLVHRCDRTHYSCQMPLSAACLVAVRSPKRPSARTLGLRLSLERPIFEWVTRLCSAPV